jgi:hypothetical protein
MIDISILYYTSQIHRPATRDLRLGNHKSSTGYRLCFVTSKENNKQIDHHCRRNHIINTILFQKRHMFIIARITHTDTLS